MWDARDNWNDSFDPSPPAWQPADGSGHEPHDDSSRRTRHTVRIGAFAYALRALMAFIVAFCMLAMTCGTATAVDIDNDSSADSLIEGLNEEEELEVSDEYADADTDADVNAEADETEATDEADTEAVDDDAEDADTATDADASDDAGISPLADDDSELVWKRSITPSVLAKGSAIAILDTTGQYAMTCSEDGKGGLLPEAVTLANYGSPTSAEDTAALNNVAYWKLVLQSNGSNFMLQCVAEDAQNSGKYIKVADKAVSMVDEANASGMQIITTGSTPSGQGIIQMLSENNWEPLSYNVNNSNYGFTSNGDMWASPNTNLYVKQEPTTYTVKTDTVSPNSAVINLFDYWELSDDDGGRWGLTPSWNDPTTPTTPVNHPSTAINSDADASSGQRALQFVLNPSTDQVVWSESENRNVQYSLGSFNQYVGDGNPPVSGLVQNTLVNHYPVLSENANFLGNSERTANTVNTKASLDYLFDPTIEHEGKVSYRNVQGLLSLDEDGYFGYDSSKNYAYFDESGSNSFTVYEDPIACDSTSWSGQFFPFNAPEEVDGLTSCQAGELNHFFGMSITTRFKQDNGGYTNASRDTATTFEFSGDDDVWIFIDDVLVADLGGIHQPASVTINFATGEVDIPGTTAKSLRESFEAANATTTVAWNETDTTFADDTTHVLRFFYLERGADVSNMSLHYNLNEVPETRIYKVDQYGQALEGATFATYRTNGETDEDGNKLYLVDGTEDKYMAWPSNAYVDTATGNVYADSSMGTLLFRATYVSTTDADGSILFVDEDDALLSLSELEDMLGPTFILREIVVPGGYHVVSDDCFLYFLEGQLLLNDDPYHTGIWASPTIMSTATENLYGIQYDPSDPNGHTHVEIPYYSKYASGGNVQGTLFAVLLKRNGSSLDNIYDMRSWTRVYGNDDYGYTQIDVNDVNEGTTTAIQAALCQTGQADGAAVPTSCTRNMKYGDAVFQYVSGDMQLYLTDLPGDPTQYYSFIESAYFNGSSETLLKAIEEKNNNVTPCANDADCVLTEERSEALDNMEYMVAYFWTSAKDLTEAKADNTMRVHSHKGSVQYEVGLEEYEGFGLEYGAKIQIPNIENRLIFQNHVYYSHPTDTDGQESNLPYVGTGFALYDVDESSTNSQLYYKADTGETIVLDKVADGVTADGDVDTTPSEEAEQESAVVKGDAWLFDSETETVKARGSYVINDEVDRDESASAGVITVTIGNTSYTISPSENAEGRPQIKPTLDIDDEDNYIGRQGSNYFKRLLTGRYALRQTTAPCVVRDRNVPYGDEGYLVATSDGTRLASCSDVDSGAVILGAGQSTEYLAANKSVSLVEVASGAVYGNAGTDNDGIIVGNGAGFIATTMNVVASRGTIDETLSWIATMLKTNYSTTFSTVDAWQAASGYARDTYSSSSGTAVGIATEQTGSLSDAMVTYLEYDPGADGVIFDYAPNANQDMRQLEINGTVTNATTKGEGTMRLFTDAGWASLQIYQDYGYGCANRAKTTHYENLMVLEDNGIDIACVVTDGDDGIAALAEAGEDVDDSDSSVLPISRSATEITSLFSNSTFIRVYNHPSQTITIEKVEAGTEEYSTYVDADGSTFEAVSDYSVKVAGATFQLYKYVASSPAYAPGLVLSDEEDLKSTWSQDGTDYYPAYAKTCEITDSDGKVTGTQAECLKLYLEPSTDGTVIDTAADLWTWTTDGTSDATQFTSDKAGTVIEHLQFDEDDGYYYVEEIAAPTGYISVVGGRVELVIKDSSIDAGLTRSLANDSDAFFEIKVSVDGMTLWIENQTYKIIKTIAGYEERDSQDNVTGYSQQGLVAGAGFQLYRCSSGTVDDNDCVAEYLTVDSDGTMIWGTTPGQTFTSDDTGVILKAVALTDGTYYLVETVTPDGFRSMEGATVQIVFANGSMQSATALADESGDKLLTVYLVDEFTLYIENSSYPTIVKVAAGTDVTDEYGAVTGYRVLLSDASFLLKTTGADSSTVYLKADGDYESGWTWTTDEKLATTLTSDAFGVVLRSSVLSDGTFTIVETEAPEGYLFVKDGAVTVTTANGKITDFSSSSFTTKTSADGLTLWIENEPAFTLPKTGGNGFPWYWVFLGLVLVLVAIRLARKMADEASGTPAMSQ
ncbi:SpaA isopeptide-forming pilin-related protein [Bifidobacterium choloepi]|uniref:PA14 domain-containing protein n=1 Tax=Bifidobacterium choloepi TaxID=2614131 RepID=A0A6I5NLT6_9BIFI|nr:SpaA isopeptide-forming pilin-related protein [Bifidobacterium choloepi]NEG69742.1 hypothetical protein [Bifidobacterium choloepi]